MVRNTRLIASRLLTKLAATIQPAQLIAEHHLPAADSEYLNPQNPRLQDLKRRYANHPVIRHSLWSESYLQRELNLHRFRGDNAYIYQNRYASSASYALTTQYVLDHDSLGLMDRLSDDGLFGNHQVNFDDSLFVSRDLLDSVLEINFLEAQLGLQRYSELTILDIGAGYGRLAHRMAEAMTNLNLVLCADAIAESTFLSEFYLRFRNVDSKTRVLELDQIESRLSEYRVDVATNIHSFGECTLKSIEWWLRIIESNNVPLLFIVSNGKDLGSTETDGSNLEYLTSVLDHGYKLRSMQPKYPNSISVQKYGLYPTYYHLFEREKKS